MSSLTDLNLRDRLLSWGPVQRKSCLLGLLLGLNAAMLGCSGTNNSSGDAEQNEGSTAQLEVISTFAPITSFTKAVVGDRAIVTQLVPHNVSPHDYDARPEDVLKLSQADVVVENGLEFEPFLDNMVQASENQDIVVIDSSEGIAVMASEDGAHSDEAGHEDHGHDDHGHEDDAEKSAHSDEKHDGHQHGPQDPHVWLDPKRAMQQVENIRDGLIEADPQGADIYQANAQRYIDQLNALDKEITNQLKPYQGKTFVTYHDFANYFAQSYGLTTEFLVGVPSENASPGDVTRVIDAVKQSNLKTLLTEPQIQGNPFAALANDLQISVSVFDPMGTSQSPEIQADSYIATMQNNVKNLSTAFSTQSQQAFWIKGPARSMAVSGPDVFLMAHTN